MSHTRDGDRDDESGEADPDGARHEVALQTEAEVDCPFCGERTVIGLDPGGGDTQEYVEDCQVCCRPWRVAVRYDDAGAATIRIEPS